MYNFFADGKRNYYTDCFDIYEKEVVFASIHGYVHAIEHLIKHLANKVSLSLDNYGSHKFIGYKNYHVFKSVDKATNLAHLVMYQKEQEVEDVLTIHYFSKKTNYDEALAEAMLHLFPKIVRFSNLYIDNEWQTYFFNCLRSRYLIASDGLQYREYFPKRTKDDKGISALIPLRRITVVISQSDIANILKQGMQTGAIGISTSENSSNTSVLPSMSVFDYIQNFSEPLSHIISKSFTPLYDPKIHKIRQSVKDFTYWCYNSGKGIRIFNAQETMIEAAIKAIDKHRIVIINGECGVGKTAIGAGITYGHGRQLGYNTVVMSPKHLLEKWCREITSFVPNARCVIVESIPALLELKDEINNSDKPYNLYIIISYSSAKLSYYEMPSSFYNANRRAYCCPHCKQKLVKLNPAYKKAKKADKPNYPKYINRNYEDFLSKNSLNSKCPCCSSPLWRAVGTKEKVQEWLKVAYVGWVNIKDINRFMESEDEASVQLVSDKLQKIITAVSSYNATVEDVYLQQNVKLPLSEYIKRFFNKKIHYTIFDEIHELKSQHSLAHKALDDLAHASRYCVGLTGTLINGYAESLFYILQSLIPQMMIGKGYGYESVSLFKEKYGVQKIEQKGNKNEKRDIPGVSPELFTDFLSEACGFISLDDVAEGLPSYTENPISVPLDNEATTYYTTAIEAFKDAVAWGSEDRIVAKSFMDYLTLFPDHPEFDFGPIINPRTKRVVFTPKPVKNQKHEKTEKTLEIIREKIDAGERVLLYYEWITNSSIRNEFLERLKEEDYCVALLESNSGTFRGKKEKVSIEDRERWVNYVTKKGAEVLICTPALVKTGLDLLAFTTIIFLQLGYDIYTMRQASKRSYRLSQTNDVSIYFIYYENTLQEQVLSLMATKLQAGMSAEGKFPDEGLSALSFNDSLENQLITSIVKGIENKVDFSGFDKRKRINKAHLDFVPFEEEPKTRQELTYTPKKKTFKHSFDRVRKAANAQKNTSQSDTIIFDLFKTNTLRRLY